MLSPLICGTLLGLRHEELFTEENTWLVCRQWFSVKVSDHSFVCFDKVQKFYDGEALVVKDLNLEHVVITSVDRDDLEDGGSEHFYKVVKATREKNPETSIEVLTPDFLRKGDAYKKVLEADLDVFNHNIETVPRLYTKVRPGARYFASLELLKNAKVFNKKVFTKSGIMVGLGETKEEVIQVMDDLRSAEVDFITIGQYLQPSAKHHPLDRYYHPDEFKEFENIAKTKGFLLVSSSPLTRSSYHADEDFRRLQDARNKKLECHPHH